MSTKLNGLIVLSLWPTDAIQIGTSTFYYDLSSLVRHILKHNVLTYGGVLIDLISKDAYNQFSEHDTLNRNDEYLAEFFNREQACLPKLYIPKKDEKTMDFHIQITQMHS